MRLDPECFRFKNLFFVRASGTYSPCCYTTTNDQLEKFLGEELYDQLNLNKYSYEEIVNSQAWVKIRTMVRSDNPLPICRLLCTERKPGNERIDMLNHKKVSFK
jgi:hypothetical protein